MPIWVDEGRFPQGGDFVRAVGRDISTFQAILATNSGDGNLRLVSSIIGNLTSTGVSSNTSYVYNFLQSLSGIISVHVLHHFDIVSVGTLPLYIVSNQYVFTGNAFGVPQSASSFWRMAQFNPGALPHWYGVFSDLYVYDVFSSYLPYGRRAIHDIDADTSAIFSTDIEASTHNLVSTSYYTTISGEVDECLGDGEPPFITLFSPTTSGIHLRPQNQIIDFSLSDAVGGVDLSTISVSLDSPSTSGVITLIQNGIDQTGGNVSVVGDATSYRFTYTPPFLWDYNEFVLVTISGSDLPPTFGGNPFFCEGNTVNTFTGDIPFQVLNYEEFPAQITALPDTAPPYINQLFPASGTVGNSVFTSVSLDITDALTGVDLSSVVVSVNSIPIINNGIPTSSETTILGNTTTYTVTHDPTTSFGYGSTVVVGVSSQDRAFPTPNQMSTSYSFDCIADSTLVISNFEPAAGTHIDPEGLDVVVDITDATHGVDTNQTFFVINGTIISGTQTGITDGVRLTYHPPNDFAYTEPMQVTVHGVNSDLVAPVIKEQFYSLYYGYRLLLPNTEHYAHSKNIDVFVRARNTEQLHKDLATGYFFTTYTQPQADMAASIVAINPQRDLPATLIAQGPEHRYGETVTVEFSVEDLDGRLLGPYTFTYTIETN